VGTAFDRGEGSLPHKWIFHHSQSGDHLDRRVGADIRAYSSETETLSGSLQQFGLVNS
jgi:hypothetical protein